MLALSTPLRDASFTAGWVALSTGLVVVLLAIGSLLATAEAHAWGSSA